MQETKNYKLKKPATNDYVKIEDLNENMDILDVTLKQTEDNIKTLQENKVDKVSGKQLSDENYSTADKNKLNNIEAGANKYVHPSNHPASMVTGLHAVATSGDYNDLKNKPTINYPITSVNNKNGDVVLNASDIKCNDGKTVETSLDDKQSKIDNNLNTKEKTVVGSINELNTNFENYKKDYVVNNATGRTGGNSTNYTLTLNPAPMAYKELMNVTIIPHTNSIGNPTLNINGLGTTPLLNQDNTPVELKKDIPYTFVRVGNNFFIRSNKINSIPKWVSQSGTWAKANPMPTPRSGCGAATVGSNIYVVGGSEKSTALNTIECYDTINNTWSPRQNMPTPRNAIDVVAVGNNIYAIGDNETSNNKIVECYDTLTDTWTVKANMLTGRGFLTCSTVGSNIYAIGGWNSKALSIVECYDTLTNTWTPRKNMTYARNALTSSSVGDNIYAIGGGDGYIARVERYNTITDSWSKKSDMPQGIQGLTSSSIGNYIYTMGGLIDAQESTVVQCYNTVSDSWSYKTNMTYKRNLSTSSSTDNNIYVIGGLSNDIRINAVECLIQ